MSLGSPRDPRSTETLQSFSKAVDWAKAGRFTQQDIDEAKLSVFSIVDAPVAPSDKGICSKPHSATGVATVPVACPLCAAQTYPWGCSFSVSVLATHRGWYPVLPELEQS